jgi:hypothetical protein
MKRSFDHGPFHQLVNTLHEQYRGDHLQLLESNIIHTSNRPPMVYQVAAIVHSDGVVDRLPDSATPQQVLGEQVSGMVGWCFCAKSKHRETNTKESDTECQVMPVCCTAVPY